jgi:hypothetical protein
MADTITVSLIDADAWEDVSPRQFKAIGERFLHERQRRIEELLRLQPNLTKPPRQDDEDKAEEKRGRGRPPGSKTQDVDYDKLHAQRLEQMAQANGSAQ